VGAQARLSTSVVDVDPGGRASLVLTVRNTGTVVDEFSFELLGAACAWTTFEVASVSLFPQADQAVQVTFAPPRAADTASGAIAFAIRVRSREDAEGSAVEEGTVNVAPFSEVIAELAPRAARILHRSRLQVLVDNRSNISYQAELAGADDDAAYGYTFRPPLVDVAPGTVAFAKLTVRTKHSYWRGPSTTQPFQVFLRQQQVAAAEEPSVEVPAGPHPPEICADGAIVRDPLLPSWLPKVLAVAAVLLLLLALCWYKLVKPQIAAAAQNQVTKALKPINKELHKLGTPTTTTPPPPVTTTPAGTTTTTTRPHVTTTTTTATTTPKHKVVPPKRPAVISTPINASLTATGNNSTAAYTVPSGKTLEVTDILLENSAGASGDIYLENDGTVLMSWALANFRDLDYHWITPMYFDAKSQLQLAVRGCNTDCRPALYFAGDMTSVR